MSGGLEGLLGELLKSAKVQELLALPELEFNLALERLRRAHLERKGFRFLDENHPAGCESCEG